jgi:hypothetical protein
MIGTESLGLQRLQIFPNWHRQQWAGETFCSEWNERLVTGRLIDK